MAVKSGTEYDEMAVCAVPGRRGESLKKSKGSLEGCSERSLRLDALREKSRLGRGSMWRELLGAILRWLGSCSGVRVERRLRLGWEKLRDGGGVSSGSPGGGGM